jgi:hypothetical protein
MTDDTSTALPPGWYDSQDGSRRYWTGSEWVSPPTPDKPQKQMSKRAKRNIMIAVVVVVVLVIVGVIVGVEAKASADHTAAVAHALQVKKKHDALVAKQEAAAAAKAAAAAEQKSKDDAERALRMAEIKEVAASVKKTAQQDVNDGTLDGPIIDSSCQPLGGGSTDDLTQKTATLTCFAANKKNSDGSENGYNFSATINWDTGEYSWKLGQ